MEVTAVWTQQPKGGGLINETRMQSCSFWRSVIDVFGYKTRRNMISVVMKTARHDDPCCFLDEEAGVSDDQPKNSLHFLWQQMIFSRFLRRLLCPRRCSCEVCSRKDDYSWNTSNRTRVLKNRTIIAKESTKTKDRWWIINGRTNPGRRSLKTLFRIFDDSCLLRERTVQMWCSKWENLSTPRIRSPVLSVIWELFWVWQNRSRGRESRRLSSWHTDSLLSLFHWSSDWVGCSRQEECLSHTLSHISIVVHTQSLVSLMMTIHSYFSIAV